MTEKKVGVAEIKRIKGITIIDFGQLKIKTNFLNRSMYKNLDKSKLTKPADLIPVLETKFKRR